LLQRRLWVRLHGAWLTWGVAMQGCLIFAHYFCWMLTMYYWIFLHAGASFAVKEVSCLTKEAMANILFLHLTG
jgi:hypothetical protein